MLIEKIYLGLSLGFNSSAAVYSSERGLLAAISQERINGKKNTKELPLEAAVKCCQIAGVKRINKIAISHYEEIRDNYFNRYGENYDIITDSWKNAILAYLNNYEIYVKDYENIIRVPHHVAHGVSTFAFYGEPNKGDYIITSDGFGDGFSGMIRRYKYDCDINKVPLKNSIALVYQFVTGALGYKEHQHEGKITGLAAFGKPKYIDNFDNLYFVSDDGNYIDFKYDKDELTEEEKKHVQKSAIIDFDKFLNLKKTVYGLVNYLIEEKYAKPEDIAASVQEWAEKNTIAWLRLTVTDFDRNAYLAGGLFANVKINQRIKDSDLFKNVYVCPAMGDEGTAVGAAVYAAGNIVNTIVSPNQCGTVADESEINHWFDVHCLNKISYKTYLLHDDTILAEWIAEKLSKNKIVCLVKGRMEFGPRALCHRSILYNCDTKETNTWLNDKLSRTEFMPFAPVCREEVANDLFKRLTGGRDSAKHMTMTFDCTDEFIQNYPAACHVDNTARPQIVSQNEDPFIWSVLERYQALTGKKALINTSFNLHNNPIIESTEVAVKSWLKSDTDILVIGNTIIEKVQKDD